MPGNSLHFLGQFVTLCLLAGMGSDTAFVCCSCWRTELSSFPSFVGEACYFGREAGIFRNLLNWHPGCQCSLGPELAQAQTSHRSVVLCSLWDEHTSGLGRYTWAMIQLPKYRFQCCLRYPGSPAWHIPPSIRWFSGRISILEKPVPHPYEDVPGTTAGLR